MGSLAARKVSIFPQWWNKMSVQSSSWLPLREGFANPHSRLPQYCNTRDFTTWKQLSNNQRTQRGDRFLQHSTEGSLLKVTALSSKRKRWQNTHTAQQSTGALAEGWQFTNCTHITSSSSTEESLCQVQSHRLGCGHSSSSFQNLAIPGMSIMHSSCFFPLCYNHKIYFHHRQPGWTADELWFEWHKTQKEAGLWLKRKGRNESEQPLLVHLTILRNSEAGWWSQMSPSVGACSVLARFPNTLNEMQGARKKWLCLWDSSQDQGNEMFCLARTRWDHPRVMEVVKPDL